MIHDMLARVPLPEPTHNFSEEQIRDRKVDIFLDDGDLWAALDAWARGLLSDSELMSRAKVCLAYGDNNALDSLTDESRQEAGA